MANTENYEQLSAILNSVGDAVIAADREGLITFMNQVAEALTGWKKEEATGKQVTEILDIHVGTAGDLKKSTILTEALQKGSVTAEGLPTASEADYNTWIVEKSLSTIPSHPSKLRTKSQPASLSRSAISPSIKRRRSSHNKLSASYAIKPN